MHVNLEANTPMLHRLVETCACVALHHLLSMLLLGVESTYSNRQQRLILSELSVLTANADVHSAVGADLLDVDALSRT